MNGILELRQAIVRKNEAVQSLVENEKNQFDILFTKYDSQRNEGYAVAKIDPLISIRNCNKLFINLASCKVSDHIHITQCYSCQSFGHRRNSIHCPLRNLETNVCLYFSKDHLSRDCSLKLETTYKNYKCSDCA